MSPEARQRFEYYKAAPPITLRRVIFERLAHSISKPAGAFHELVLSVFTENLPIAAASFYAYDSEFDLLVLLRQKGFNYADYNSFELSKPSLALRVAKSLTAEAFSNLAEHPEYNCKTLAQKYQLNSVVVLPLIRSLSHERECLGVIALYPTDLSDIAAILRLSTELSDFIGTLYLHQLQSRMLLIRDAIIAKAYLSQDLNSCLHRILALSQTTINVEAGSIFLYDPSVRLLRLHATTGMNVDKAIARQSIFYGPSDDKNITWRSFRNNTVECFRNVDGPTRQGKYVEKTLTGPQSFLAFPIKRTQPDIRDEVRGVIRYVNKKVTHSVKTQVVGFTAEDRLLTAFITDMVSVIVHMFRSRERRVDFFEQIMHGSGTNLSACLQNLDILERHGKLLEKLEPELHFHFLDTRDFLLDIKRQMDRLSHGKPLEEKDIKLGSEVLMKVVALFDRMAESRDVPSHTITNLKQGGFFSLPEIVGDPDATFTVFRNLVENAIKYRDINSGACMIDLAHAVTPDTVSIYVIDHGIGIPEGAMNSIFQDGFRAENAVRQDPAGTGLGLAQCKDIMERMQGDIFLEKCKPTQFRLDFKRSRT
jgi:signal transduction histidine kinase